MKRIIIVDDRIERQSQFLPNGDEDVILLNKLPYVENKVGQKYNSLIEALLEGNESELLEYDLWIFHRSLLVKKKMLLKIQELAKKNKRPLILFSGGITYSSYSESDFPFLIMNSQVFYSEKLFPFLDKYANAGGRLIEIVYGENWQLSYLFKYRQVLDQVPYPGRPERNKDELEQVLGKLSIDEVNDKIFEILQGI